MERSLCVLTPILDRPTVPYMASILHLYGATVRDGIRFEWQYARGNSNLQQARNSLIAQFLAGDLSHALLVDADVGFSSVDALRLLGSPHDVIGGAIRKRSERGETDQHAWGVAFEPEPVVKPSGCMTVKGLGTAFMMLSRRGLERIIAERADLKRQAPFSLTGPAAEHFYYLFGFDDPATGSEGEDLHFCALWRSLCGKVWLDPSIKLNHEGTTVYTGDIGKCIATLLQPA